jgi:ubiquinone/menaquinone biosynthesis C-methylase UbiE
MDPKTMWGAGDYGAVAEHVTGVGDTTVERAGIEAGMEVLDVACGTGNATIPAARLGPA